MPFLFISEEKWFLKLNITSEKEKEKLNRTYTKPASQVRIKNIPQTEIKIFKVQLLIELASPMNGLNDRPSKFSTE